MAAGLGKIIVTPERLRAVAGQVENLSGEYKAEYENLFATVNEMKEKGAWTGKDNEAFTNQINGFNNDFTNMFDLVTEYYEYLRVAANEYEELQSDISNRVKNLSQGN